MTPAPMATGLSAEKFIYSLKFNWSIKLHRERFNAPYTCSASISVVTCQKLELDS